MCLVTMLRSQDIKTRYSFPHSAFGGSLLKIQVSDRLPVSGLVVPELILSVFAA